METTKFSTKPRKTTTMTEFSQQALRKCLDMPNKVRIKVARTRVVTHFGFHAILNAKGEGIVLSSSCSEYSLFNSRAGISKRKAP